MYTDDLLIIYFNGSQYMVYKTVENFKDNDSIA